MDEHPLNRPVAYFVLIVFCTLISGIAGHFSVTYGIRGYWLIYACGGFGLGVFLSSCCG